MSDSIYEQMGLVTTESGIAEPGPNWPEFSRLPADIDVRSLNTLGYLAANMIAASYDHLPEAPAFMNAVSRFGRQVRPLVDSVLLEWFEAGGRTALEDIARSPGQAQARMLGLGPFESQHR